MKKKGPKPRLKSILPLILFVTTSVFAEATNNVPVGDPVYEDIDLLIAFGAAPDVIYGQRPFSEREIRRIAENAKHFIEENPQFPHTDRVLSISERLIRRTDSDPIELLDRSDVRFTQLNSSARDIPIDNGVGAIEGYVHPLVDEREGVDYVRGQNFEFETEHAVRWTSFSSFKFSPLYQISRQSNGRGDAMGSVKELYGKFHAGNFELEAGRDHFNWGQSENGGLLFSNNARAIDMVKISNDSPFIHPWIFKYLGPSKYTFFVANLGPDRTAFPYAYLYGAKFSFKPVRILEIGLSETIITGGDGSPNLSWSDPIGEFFPVHKVGRNILYSDVSDHRFGFLDIRFTMPWFRNTVLYYESFYDDSPTRIWGHPLSYYWIQTAVTFGASVPRVTPDGRLGMGIEFKHIPPWGYRHGTWLTGYTLNRELIGDPLGSDADGSYLTARYRLDDERRLNLKFSFESRGTNQYTQTKRADGGFEQVVALLPEADERRYRLEAKYAWDFAPGFTADVEGGYEHVNNFDFRGVTKNNFLLGAALQFRPGEWAKR
jgi:hypothetical protein